MHFDIFNNDAFSVSQLALAIAEQPRIPGTIGREGWFNESGITTTSVSLEKVGKSLRLVQSSPRGGPGQTVPNSKRTLRNFRAVHLQENDGVLADEVQNLRAFGSETDVQAVQAVVNDKLADMKTNIDITLEHMRIGAVKGQVMDADGVTVLADMYDAFGVAKQVMDFQLDAPATKVKQKCVDLSRLIRDQLGGLPMTGVKVLCSDAFFDFLTGHAAVEAAFDRWMNGEFLRTQQTDVATGTGGFWFGGIYWQAYNDKVGTYEFIEDGTALAVPLGVPKMFRTFYAPADYMETVNTMGIPYYAKKDVRRDDKGVDLEAQSNPLMINTQPGAVIELTI